MKRVLGWTVLVVVLLCGLRPAAAQIDLVTVPERRAVQLTIYNGADLTLVRDRRLLTFKRGRNVLQFTWAGTLIDPSSLEMRFRTHDKDLTLQDTVFPPQRNEGLQWEVDSSFDGDAEVEITYFTSGLSWTSAYVAHLTQGDRSMDLSGDIVLTNHSGEDYPNASVRLIVGRVNLVEEIATLARNRGGWGSVRREDRDAAYRGFKKAEKDGYDALDDMNAPASASAPARKGVVKQGLSEYFLFSIEGEETVPNGWSKALNAVDVKNIPVEVTFRLKDNWGEKFHRFLRFDNKSLNDKKDRTNLGQSPLPDGLIHIFRRYDNKDLGFLQRMNMQYIAVGDKCELDTGAQDEVVIERNLYDYRRENIREERDDNGRKTGRILYDEFFSYRTTLRNSLDFPALLEIERSFNWRAEVGDLPYKKELVNYNTFKYYPTLKGGEETTFNYTVKVKHD